MKKKKEVKEKKEDKNTLLLATDREIAMDFATKVYKKFKEMIKSIIFFGSGAKKTSLPSSDIDIVIIIDDVSIRWDLELISYYREELGKIIVENPYKKSIHVNSVKLSTWWDDLKRGDPIIINIIRFGETLIDFGGFFSPLKILLQQGKIKPSPEAIYSLLNRAPTHLIRVRTQMLSMIEGLYWCCVDSAHAALIAAKEEPSSPEIIADLLTKNFVERKMLKEEYVDHYLEIFSLYKKVVHESIKEINGKKIDDLFKKSEEFLKEMSRLVKEFSE